MRFLDCTDQSPVILKLFPALSFVVFILKIFFVKEFSQTKGAAIYMVSYYTLVLNSYIIHTYIPYPGVYIKIIINQGLREKCKKDF